MSRKVCLLGFTWMLLVMVGVAQENRQTRLYVTDNDRQIYERYIGSLEANKDLPIGQLVIRTALFFVGTPYVASTLEKEPEGLVVNLRELDCTTFVESVLALARTVSEDSLSFKHYCDNLRQLRYRNGLIKDYTDRLHYMADWLYENERKGIVQDIGKAIGGVSLPMNLSFISSNSGRYAPLKDHPAFVNSIAEKEREINARSYYYVPKLAIDRCKDKIKDGDVLCFVTSIKGLDVTHVGIAYWRGGELTFIHASSSAKKVVVQERTLQDYVMSIKSCKGILLARPLPVH